MRVSFEHRPHPHIAAHKTAEPPKVADGHVGFNGRVALTLTTVVGTMWCAYAQDDAMNALLEKIEKLEAAAAGA